MQIFRTRSSKRLPCSEKWGYPFKESIHSYLRGLCMRLFLVTFIVSVFMGSTVVWSEETTLTVEGMHCSGCKHMISKNVCENKELSATFEKCNVELVDAKKQIGRVILVPKADQKIDIKWPTKKLRIYYGSIWKCPGLM